MRNLKIRPARCLSRPAVWPWVAVVSATIAGWVTITEYLFG